MAAEVGGGGSDKKGKKGRKKKGNPRIDMTPMVDLGFLLLTFFVLTTTMSTPSTMPVVVPEDDKDVEKKEDVPKLAEGKVLNLLIGGKNRVFYYQGVENVQLSMTNYSPKGLRPIIKDYQQKVAANYKEKDPLVVIIKMTKDANFKNWVDLIDEMNITEQKKYVLIDITTDELEFIKGYEASQSLDSSIEKSLSEGTAPAGKDAKNG